MARDVVYHGETHTVTLDNGMEITYTNPLFPAAFYVNVPGPGDDAATFPRVYIWTAEAQEHFLSEDEFIDQYGRDAFRAVYNAAYDHHWVELFPFVFPAVGVPKGHGTTR